MQSGDLCPECSEGHLHLPLDQTDLVCQSCGHTQQTEVESDGLDLDLSFVDNETPVKKQPTWEHEALAIMVQKVTCNNCQNSWVQTVTKFPLLIWRNTKNGDRQYRAIPHSETEDLPRKYEWATPTNIALCADCFKPNEPPVLEED